MENHLRAIQAANGLITPRELYHSERNHQGLDNRPLRPIATDFLYSVNIKRRERLGGMLSHYHRQPLDSSRLIFWTLRPPSADVASSGSHVVPDPIHKAQDLESV